ncbi:hypothetical protein O1611_g8043 [Lasiodiplodia mahajangana]|uniref:Uncharacterized protein n=1 Tax=Lasiodiplodia mahajangana TaxID=1108764 RepID=A0ACC2JDN6_9PEZI|nr:hypothetical protein O1611_g8043 [Lasiodiplodia mahajangana]
MGSNLTKPFVDSAPTCPSSLRHAIDLFQISEQLIDFDESLLRKTRPPLGATEDFHLTADQVRKIFGIDEKQFTPIPAQLVVPVLKGRWTKKNVYHTSGWLYILEPQEWLPVVRHGDSVIASQFKSPHSTNRKDISEAKFNSDCKASIEFHLEGSYYGTSAGVTQSSNISFEYSSTSVTEEILRKNGVAGDTLVEELVLYPILRCKATRKQRIDYIINTKGKNLKWGNNSSGPKHREQLLRVPSSRLGRIAKMQFHPVPVNGSGHESMARLLPIPRIASNGEIEVVTLISCADWQDWYIYEAEFQECSETIDLAASRNNAAFRPTSCWTTFLDDNRDEEVNEEVNEEPEPSRGMIGNMGYTNGRKGKGHGLEDENQRPIECALEPLES